MPELSGKKEQHKGDVWGRLWKETWPGRSWWPDWARLGLQGWRRDVYRSQRGHQDSWESLQTAQAWPRDSPTHSRQGWAETITEGDNVAVECGGFSCKDPRSLASTVHVWTREFCWLQGGSLDQQLFSILELGPDSEDLVSSYTALNSSRGFVSSEQFLTGPACSAYPSVQSQSLFPRSFSESFLSSRPCRAPNRVIQETL